MADTEARYHALDNLRAILMWLGIVLHSAMNYMHHPAQFPWRDERLTLLADLLVGVIHAFRMPAFFIIAGFLAAMLLTRRGPREFLRHRTLRLALPFVLFWPVLMLACWAVAVLFMNRIAHRGWSLDTSALPEVGIGPASVLHLWFLWMLFWFCVATAACALLPRAPFAVAGRWLAAAGAAPWGFLPLTVPLLIAGLPYPKGLLMTSTLIVMPWPEWLHNGMFFAFGLALWAHRARLLPHYERHWKRYAWAGFAAFMVFGGLDKRAASPDLAVSAAFNALAWLWAFAAIGLGLKLLNRRSERLAYLADSAYWVYLVHLPLTVLFAVLLYQAPLFAEVKILLGIAGTTLVCLGSYQLLVRHTWVSVLLNGKRHPRRGTPPVHPAAAAG